MTAHPEVGQLDVRTGNIKEGKRIWGKLKARQAEDTDLYHQKTPSTHKEMACHCMSSGCCSDI